MKTNPQLQTRAGLGRAVNGNTVSGKAPKAAKRVAIYARVSTQEQTKGLFPSCDSQIEELETFCKSRNWQVVEAIKDDEGHRAGTLLRPGLAHLRWLVESGQITGVVCTWYNRLIGSRDFYILDHEFKNHNVDFVTIHDPADRTTATGRMLESMLVTIKTFENEQVGEKVRTKLRQRAEKGLWNGGHVPFGFGYEATTQRLLPKENQLSLVVQMFRTYVDTRSDFTVRNWLKARQIPAPGGNAIWSVGTVRNVLSNRLYIGEIELNRENRERPDAPEPYAYRIIKMAHEPIVPRELWETAQALRREKAGHYPNNPGAKRSRERSQQNKGRAYSWSKDQRVYPLQGMLSCAACHSLMTPHYVFHKAGNGRRKDSFINHYVCTRHRKYGTDCDHRNRVLARVPEAWVLERVRDLATAPRVLEAALNAALKNSEQNLQPASAELMRTRAGLHETQKQIDALMGALTSGPVTPALMQMVNERASELKQQRESLLADQRRLLAQLAPLENRPDAAALRRALADFSALMEEAEPLEVQRLLRVVVQRLEWGADGQHKLQLHSLGRAGRAGGTGKGGSQGAPWDAGGTTGARDKGENSDLSNAKQPAPEGTDWFDISMQIGSSNWIRTSNPPINSRMLHR